MIRVLVLYPRGKGDVFDYAYYRESHLKLVRELLKPERIEVDRGLPDSAGRPSPFHVVTHMVFTSREDLRAKFAAHGKTLTEDKERFTNVQIVNQIGEIEE